MSLKKFNLTVIPDNSRYNKNYDTLYHYINDYTRFNVEERLNIMFPNCKSIVFNEENNTFTVKL